VGKNYGFEARVLLCNHCGAPLALPEAGGRVACQYCAAENLFSARAELPVFAPPAARALSEPERLARLRAQLGVERPAPALLAPLLDGTRVPAWRMDEAFGVHRSLRQRALAGDYSAADDLAFLALALGRELDQDPVRQRALLESALDALTVPRHRQLVLGALARGAAREGDVAGATRWLERCDPNLDDLMADSSYRVARALCSTLGAAHDDVLAVLGGDAKNGVPMAPEWRALSVLLRANAHFAAGRSKDADAVLVSIEVSELEPEYLRYRGILAENLLRRAETSHRTANGCIVLALWPLAIGGWTTFALFYERGDDNGLLAVVAMLGAIVGSLAGLPAVGMTALFVSSVLKKSRAA